MTFRQATTADIKALFEVRMSVTENVLVNTDLVTDDICASYLTDRGKGWLCEVDGNVVAFAIADIVDNSIWALFVRPGYEGMGIGRQLQTIMLDWYFAKGKQHVWLTTAPNTRAAGFYTTSGWTATGHNNHGEIKFELTIGDWNRQKECD